ncbi:MAG: helix-turn-helix transcriptional regulator [Nitrospinota bacterium]
MKSGNNRVKKIRETKMMSKAELARKTGLSVQTIDRVEKGHICRLDTKRKILMALGLKLEDRKKVFDDDENA